MFPQSTEIWAWNVKAGDILPNSKLIRTCVYLCSVLQKFLWKNHARLLQNQRDCYLKSIFSQFLTFHDCPREEMNCPGLLSGRVTYCLGRSSLSMQAVKDSLHHLAFWGLFSSVALRGSPRQLLHRSHQCTPFLSLLRANSLEGLCLARCHSLTQHHCFSTWFCCCFFTACVWTV